MSLRELYQEMIIDHGKTPRNFGKLSETTHCQMGHNPLCGDKLTVYIMEKHDVIEAISFEGIGCAISVASASLMTETIKGKTIAQINNLFEQFHALVTKGLAPAEDLGKLAIFGSVCEFPVRVKCATLAWHTLKAALTHQTDSVSTE